MKIVLRRGPVRALCTVLLVLASRTPARAQSLPSEPLVFAGGRVTISGDVSASYACTSAADASGTAACGADTGFFNYTDYDHSTVRLVRVDVKTAVRATHRLSILSDVRTENGAGLKPYGLYVRLHPWDGHDIDIQAGRIPPTFGAFPRRPYANDNLLIGYPLAYQYLTSLRPDSLPADADELLRMRGRGWLSNFSIGDIKPHNGMPIASAFRWDTGVQVHAATTVVEAAAALTAGSLGNPLFVDDNAGKQVAARVAIHPIAGLIIGASAARGPFITRSALAAAPAATRDRSFTQKAYGADAEYSRDYYLLRVETVVSDWTVPLAGTPLIQLPLRAIGTMIEGRYKVHPGFYVAARADHLGFSTITGTNRTDTWDAPVSRVELGGGYSIQRNLQLKASVQRNARDGGRVHRSTTTSAQLVFWF